jgi:YYY domain-containing protein
MDWLRDGAAWYGVLVLLTWGFAPWVRLLCRGLPDRGASVARPLALLGVVYPSWLLAGLDLAPYATAGLWATLAVAAASGWALALRRRAVDRDWLRALLVAEAAALAAFALYVWFRGYSPQILNTEKPMDIAFLASSARTDVVPPPDPWYAGEPINYYYLGYLLHGAVARLAAVPVAVGFNLALATSFSMALVAAGGLGFNLSRRWVSDRRAALAAVLAGSLVVVAGNLHAPLELLRHPRATLDATWWGGVGWDSSRIVVDRVTRPDGSVDTVETINEVPAFSFVLGDLHPHVMALPFTLAALALAAVLFFGRTGGSRLARGELIRIALAGAVIGSLYALNSWDYPTFLLIAGLATWFGLADGLGARQRALGVAVLGGASLLAWAPFFLTFAPPVGGTAPEGVRGVPVLSTLLETLGAAQDRTSIREFLTVFGLPYAFAVWFLATGLARGDRPGDGDAEGAGRSIVVAAVGLGLLALLAAAPVVLLCGVPLVVALELLRRDRTPGPRTAATALYALGFVLLPITEFFFIQDVFSSRMNTLFKVYYQVWTLFGIATALAVLSIWRETRLWRGVGRRATRPALTGAVAVALLAAAVYPVLSSYRYTEVYGPREWAGLDGLEFLQDRHPDELAALAWLGENAGPDDVLLEAVGCAYKEVDGLAANRASAYTGVPTVMGWQGHERQWRSGQPDLFDQIDERGDEVPALYGEPGSEALADHGVTLLYVGFWERTGLPERECGTDGPYPAVAAPGFPGPGWQVAFEQGDVAIYRRATASAASGS